MSWRFVRTLVLLIVSLSAGVVAFYLVPGPLPELSRAEFLAEVQAGHIHRIEIEDQEVILGDSATRGKFHTSFDKVRDKGLPDELRALGIEIWYSKSSLGI
jgi:hypothetical protein